jgi:L,D-transpeptidase YcbB
VNRFDASLLVDRLRKRLRSVLPVRGGGMLLLAAPLLALVLSLTLGGDTVAEEAQSGPRWSSAQLLQLRQWIDRAAEDGLPRPDSNAFEAALSAGQGRRINPLATGLALRLARMHLSGAAAQEERIEWFIADSDSARGLAPELATALADDQLDAFFTNLRPQHRDYAALRVALAAESDPARRTVIARNMERWRWLPQKLGDDFVFANAAGFEVALWREGRQVKTWAAISGKTETPTPAISSIITAVNFNPWWEVPASISSVSTMSARRGYVYYRGRYRQRPGPGNSLGQMKLVMYNPHNIYLHDTPSRGLFGARERAFSHGCIRVSDALGFAQTLLGTSKTKEEIDKIIEDKDSVLVHLPRELPVYVAYFTADTGPRGQVRFHRDIYGRDAGIVSIASSSGARVAAR